jgi:hypothetical protein
MPQITGKKLRQIILKMTGSGSNGFAHRIPRVVTENVKVMKKLYTMYKKYTTLSVSKMDKGKRPF